MPNQQGGQVLFGVTPEGRAIGQQVSERTIEELSAEIARIEPPAFPAVEQQRPSNHIVLNCSKSFPQPAKL